MKYPYFSYSATNKYGYQISSAQENINSCNVWPYVFNNPIPRCIGLKVGLLITKDPAYTRYVTSRDWYIYAYRQNYGWENVGTIYVPEATQVYIDVSFTERTITKVVAVPSYIGSYTQWTTSMSLENMKLVTNLNTLDLSANGYFKGILANYYGVTTTAVNEVSVNVDGNIVKAKHIFANVGGTLTEITAVPSGRLQTTNKEDFAVFEFTPPVAGNYTFKIKQATGDHDGWLYDSSFNQLNTDYFDSQTFTLSSGSVYYILLFQYYNNLTPADSVLQVIKET